MTMGITSPTSTTGQILKDGTPVISFDANNNATFAGTVVSNTPLGMRNRIINGGMVIDQRNAGASVTSGFPVDRFQVYSTQSSKWTAQQSTTAPTGFTNSVIITSSSSYSPISSDYFSYTTRIEGYNVADLDWGTANAKTITVSFWVRSSLTGTWTGALHNNAFNRVYPFSYTISSANTWEYKTVTIAGDTSGTWLTNNSVGIEIGFAFSVGSSGLGTAGAWTNTASIFGATGQTNLLGTNGATFYITGVQLERGSTATPFDYRPYGQEMAMCQRYYWKVDGGTTTDYVALGSGVVMSTTQARIYVKYPVAMRAAPTISYNGSIYADDVTGHLVTSIATAFEGIDQMMLDFNTQSGKTTGRGVVCYVVNSSGNNLIASAEL